MLEVIAKPLDQKSARIKAALPVTPSRGFALWLVLLLLYCLLLPSAAETPAPEAANSPGDVESAPVSVRP